MIVPIIIIAVGDVLLLLQGLRPPMARWGRSGWSCRTRADLRTRISGVIVAHAVLGIPFVIITVTATLSGFDQSLIRAAQSLGANPRTTFFKVIMPLILPGVISGALFAFVTSFDEVVAVLFIAGPDQQTIPRQMFNGIREADQPGDPGGGDDPGGDLDRAADDGRAAAPPVGPAARRDRRGALRTDREFSIGQIAV